jgi:hypothetical protein
LEDVDASDLAVYHSPAIHADMDDDGLKAAITELDFAKAEINPTEAVTEVANSRNKLLISKCPRFQ